MLLQWNLVWAFDCYQQGVYGSFLNCQVTRFDDLELITLPHIPFPALDVKTE